MQGLFPISEGQGVNPHAFPLNETERKILSTPEYQQKFLKSLDLMLDFYGVELKNNKIEKKKDWLLHFDNLEQNPHNWLRITRILKCLKEIGLVKEKDILLEFLKNEVYKTKDLDFCQSSYERFWKNV